MPIEYLLATYGYPILFLGTLLEGETPLLIASFLAHRGYLKLPWVIAVAFAGTLSADQFFFYLGRLNGESILKRRPKWREKIEKASSLLDKYHTLIMFGFRFVYGFRTLTPFVIGMSGFSPVRFLLLNTIGAILWSTTFAYAGYALGEAVEIILGDVKRFELWIVGCIAAVAVVLWFLHRRKKSQE